MCNRSAELFAVEKHGGDWEQQRGLPNSVAVVGISIQKGAHCTLGTPRSSL